MSRLALTAALLGACSATTPEPPRTADPEPRPEPGASAPAAPTAPAGAEKAPELPGAPPPTDPGWDLHTWAYARQLEVELVSDGCEAARLGDKPDETVWCAHHSDAKEGAVLHTRALYVARAKKLVKLAELPVAVSVMDDPENPKDEKARQVLRFELVRAADGMSVRAGPAKGFYCEDAMKTHSDGSVLGKALAQRIGKVCATYGTWRWSAGTLRKER